jgi:hypothetical protein
VSHIQRGLGYRKLDRLARNVALIAQLMESGVEFVAADFPQANRLTIHILAAIAEYEAKLISERAKAAIVASNARGVVWGGKQEFADRTFGRRSARWQRRAKAARNRSRHRPGAVDYGNARKRNASQGDRCGAKQPWHSSAARRGQLDSKRCPLGVAMVSGSVSRSEKMEQIRAAI